MDNIELNEQVLKTQEILNNVKKEVQKVIIGQEEIVDKILIGLLSGGHVLLEGVPGLAKSLTANVISRVIGVNYKRIQFTPDLLPADILGTEIYNHDSGEFMIKKGPLFSNIILADEINRAPAKVQSALLEAMQEKQITIGKVTYKLQEPFFVIATQNPLEQQGTYPLPEAQQDRFILKIVLDYPSRSEEEKIIDLYAGQVIPEEVPLDNIIDNDKIKDIQHLVRDIYVDDNIKNYVLDIISKTRDGSALISCGASPRASLSLVIAARARALLEGRSYVTPDDIKAVVFEVLRHRILLSYEAEAEGIGVDDIITEILDNVNLP